MQLLPPLVASVFRFNFCPMVHIDFVFVGCMGILSMFSSILINQWVVHVDIMFS